MSFYVIGPAPKRDHGSLNQTHDDLDVLNEEEIELSEVPANPSNNQSPEESKHESLNVPKFDWRASRHANKHHHIDHNCTLPQSPNDQSSHHFVAHYLANQSNNASRGHSRTSSKHHPTADPSSLFNLMRMIKGQVFEIYTPIKQPNGTLSYTQQEAFLFYDAHQSKLGSIYWSFEKQPNAQSNSDLPDFGFVRIKDPRRSIQLGKVKSVQAGPTSEQTQHLVTPLPWSNFFSICTQHASLHVSHSERLVVDQWLICLRDIFVQHDYEIREGLDTRSKENELTMRSITASSKHFTPLFNAFIDPNDPNSIENVEAASVLSLSQDKRPELSKGTFSPHSTTRSLPSPGTPVKSPTEPKTASCCVIV